jgi:sulfonate dioxygenase
MAPIALESPNRPAAEIIVKRSAYKDQASGPRQYNRELEEKGADGKPAAKYANYLPTWNPEQKYPPLEAFEHVDVGRNADSKFPELLHESTTVEDVTPTTGSIVDGVQLSQLTDKGKDQLALLVAQRKVVQFKNQDFADLPIEQALQFGGYFGRHHIHPTSGSPEAYPEIHLVHRGIDDPVGQELLKDRLSTIAWHSDVSYEIQPPGTTFLYIFDKPTSGGDTIFCDTAEAYKRLSPGFQQRLHGLKAVHSGIEQIEASKARGSICRREPVAHEHPIIRTHPVTGEKALYVNPQCKSRSLFGG